MQPQDMLRILNEAGEEAGADFNDADDVLGWFAWTVTERSGVRHLTVTYEPEADWGKRSGEKHSVTWALVPVRFHESGAEFTNPV